MSPKHHKHKETFPAHVWDMPVAIISVACVLLSFILLSIGIGIAGMSFLILIAYDVLLIPVILLLMQTHRLVENLVTLRSGWNKQVEFETLDANTVYIRPIRADLHHSQLIIDNGIPIWHVEYSYPTDAEQKSFKLWGANIPDDVSAYIFADADDGKTKHTPQKHIFLFQIEGNDRVYTKDEILAMTTPKE